MGAGAFVFAGAAAAGWSEVDSIDFGDLDAQDLTSSGDTTYTLSDGMTVRAYGTGTGDMDVVPGAGITISSTSGGHTAVAIALGDVSGYVAASDNVVQWVVAIDNMPQTGSGVDDCLSNYFGMTDSTASPFSGNAQWPGFISPTSATTGSYNLRQAFAGAQSGVDAGAVTTTVPYTGHILWSSFITGDSLRTYVQAVTSDNFVAPESVDTTRSYLVNLTARAAGSITGVSVPPGLIAWMDSYDPGSAMEITVTRFRIMARGDYP